jgi:RNA polymerase sigma-70 factor, ECF subfamily
LNGRGRDPVKVVDRGDGGSGGFGLDSATDEELVALSQGGNVGAFNRLTVRVEESVYHFVLRTLGNREEARDVCQESLLKAYQNIQRLRDGSKFKAWVHNIALNLCRDRFRSPGYRNRMQALDQTETEGGPVALELARRSPHSRHGEQTHIVRTLEQALAQLPAEQRFAIILREYQGFTSEEIGEITGVPAATVRTRIFYGLRSLRQTLGEGSAG